MSNIVDSWQKCQLLLTPVNCCQISQQSLLLSCCPVTDNKVNYCQPLSSIFHYCQHSFIINHCQPLYIVNYCHLCAFISTLLVQNNFDVEIRNKLLLCLETQNICRTNTCSITTPHNLKSLRTWRLLHYII